jgi:hypothetical protein
MRDTCHDDVERRGFQAACGIPVALNWFALSVNPAARSRSPSTVTAIVERVRKVALFRAEERIFTPAPLHRAAIHRSSPCRVLGDERCTQVRRTQEIREIGGIAAKHVGKRTANFVPHERRIVDDRVPSAPLCSASAIRRIDAALELQPIKNSSSCASSNNGITYSCSFVLAAQWRMPRRGMARFACTTDVSIRRDRHLRALRAPFDDLHDLCDPAQSLDGTAHMTASRAVDLGRVQGR